MYGVLEDGFKPDEAEAEALKLAARALHASGQRDAASGNGTESPLLLPKKMVSFYKLKTKLTICLAD